MTVAGETENADAPAEANKGKNQLEARMMSIA